MSRDEAIKKMKAVKAYMTAGNPMWGITEMGETFDAAIEALEREPKKGKWLAIGNTGLAACECGYITDRYSIYNYCPNCGARMTE